MLWANFLKLKFWKLQATFNLENVNLLSNPNVNPQNGVDYKKKRVINLNAKFKRFEILELRNRVTQNDLIYLFFHLIFI